FVDQKMHCHLTGRLARSTDLVASGVDDDHLVGFDKSLVTPRRGAHDGAVGQAGADISIRRSNVRLLVSEVAEPFDFLCGVHQRWQFYYIRIAVGAVYDRARSRIEVLAE